MNRPIGTCLSIFVMSILALPGATIVRAEDDLPKRMNFDRYEPMLKQPLFALATVAAAPVVAPNFAKDLYVANAARSAEGDMVTIGSTVDPSFKKYLTTKDPVDGYSISSIEWSDRVGATKVTISKDGQYATLSFNEALLSQRANAPAAPPVAPGMRQPMPGVPQQVQGQPGANVPQPIEAAYPGAGRTSPHVRGMIPRFPRPSTPATPDPRKPINRPQMSENESIAAEAAAAARAEKK